MSLAWRRASAADAVALRDLERRASLTAHGAVLGDRCYPDDAVLGRWRATPAELLRHRAVEPAAWRRGLGARTVGRFVARSPGAPRLWCLAGNEHARSPCERLGWRPTGGSRRTTWSPRPVEVELARAPELPA